VSLDLNDLPDLPNGWCWVSLDQLLQSPLVNGRSVPDAATGFPVLRLTALKGESIDLTERKTGRWSTYDAREFLVKREDFLVSRGNGSIRLVGRGGLVSSEPGPVAFPDTLIRVRLNPEHLNLRLFAAVWNSSVVRRQIERRAKTTAGIHKVNQTDLERTAIPLAPRAEQDRLMAELDRCLSIGNELLSVTAAGERRCGRLRESILRWAFEGKLVDQNPNDEPANALLERIRVERTVAETVGQRRRDGLRRTMTTTKRTKRGGRLS
jgi:type I restriction enzyme S subunit